LQMSLDYFRKALAEETKEEKNGDKKEEKKTAG
jgi:hypothetical protein